jgi:hypothetical protein
MKTDSAGERVIRREYKRADLGVGVRGRFYNAYRKGSNLVLLDPALAALFPSDRAVNDALGALARAAKATTKPLTRSRKATKQSRRHKVTA